MAKTVTFDKKSFLVSFILLIIFSVLFVHYYISRKMPSINKDSITNNSNNSNSNNKTTEIENKINYLEDRVNNINNKRTQYSRNSLPLSRIYNPLKYPYKSQPFYDQSWYPNLELPAQVIGCGGRNSPCLGGTQIAIANPMYPLDISDSNIAPINIRTRGPLGIPQQVGVLYKIFGNYNSILPLYGRKRYPNGNMWDYYTMTGQYGVKIPVVTKRDGDEIGENDSVFLKGLPGEAYRASIYESDFPQYVPYV